MYVKIDSSASVTLCEADDLTRFSVQVPKDFPADIISRRLSQTGAGCLDGDEVAVSVDWLQRHTAYRPDRWRDEFDRMLAYASAHGWMDPTGEAVLAHIERV